VQEFPKYSKLLLGGLATYLLIQLLLPLRHHTFKGDVLWTEEGHRLSWRMMLRSRSGLTRFKIVDKATQEASFVDLDQYLTKKQRRKVGCYPDFIWQFAQYLKKEYREQGKDISIFVTSNVRVNTGKRQPLVDPNVDLANVPWNHFSHNDWILEQK